MKRNISSVIEVDIRGIDREKGKGEQDKGEPEGELW